MRTFTLIWFGQLVSAIGSTMTFFALTLWAWDVTGSATALTLVGLFFQLPQIPMTFFAGMIVDRFNRKTLMVPKPQYTRASSMGAIVHYGSNIIGPALSGVLYPIIQLSGIVSR